MKSKKNIILLSGIILTLVLTLSISYAFFYYIEEGDEISLTSGSISIDFNEGTNYISLGNSYPKSDRMGMIDPNYYDFTVSGSKGENDDILYEIQIEPEEGNTLDEKYVKVYLTDQNGNAIAFIPKKVSDLKFSEHNGNRVIYDKFINKMNESHNYRLRIWIDESYSENIQKTFNFKINLYSVNGEAKFIYDQVAELNGTNGVVAINTDGDLANDGDRIREYRYSGSARYCTYTINGSTYRLNVDIKECPSACYTGTSLYRYDNEYISVMAGSCQKKVISNEINSMQGEVKNYIMYNDELWRIIGAFSEETSNGITENLVKIVKDEPLLQKDVPSSYTYNGIQMTLKYTGGQYSNLKYANFYWNYNNYFAQKNLNDWTKSTMQFYLNDNTPNANSYYNKIAPIYKEMINTVVYHLGNLPNNINAKTSYTNERSQNIWDGNQEKWLGKIGVMYKSDYGYASDSVNWNIYLSQYEVMSNTGSKNNWINDDITRYEWLISPSANRADLVSDIYLAGYTRYDVANSNSRTGAVSPVLYLKHDVRILSGDGSYDNPYQIGW